MKILIIDSEELYRLSVREVVAAVARHSMIFEAASKAEFMSFLSNSDRPDLIILHKATLGKEGQECLSLSKKLYPESAYLIILDRPFIGRPAKDTTIYIQRSATVNQMLTALQKVLGISYQPNLPVTVQTPDIASAIDFQKIEKEKSLEILNLSDRQKQILEMAANGLQNKEIASHLDIAEGTVKAHMHVVFKAMGVCNRTQAVIRFNAILSDRQVIRQQIARR